MDEPITPTPAAALDRYERWTRLLARVAAVTLALTILLPRLWIDTDGTWHVLWIWEHGLRGGTRSVSFLDAWSLEESFTPQLALLLVTSIVAWVAAALFPVARRGPWLTVPAVVCLYAAVDRWSGAEFEAFNFGGHFTWLVPAALGLVFSRMPGFLRLGPALCAMAGLIVLLGVFWPGAGWEWSTLRWIFRERSSTEPIYLVVRASTVLSAAAGCLLMAMGVGRGRSRAVRRLTVGVLVALIVLEFAGGLMAPPGESVDQDTPHHLVQVWNAVRIFPRVYAELLLLSVGLFAWFVGAREERSLAAVFD